jgi:hypothetical protein
LQSFDLLSHECICLTRWKMLDSEN